MEGEQTRTLVKKKLPRWCKAFLAAYRLTGNVTYSARHAGHSRAHVHQFAQANGVFKIAMDRAYEESEDNLEMEAIKRAAAGSDDLLKFLIRGRIPKYTTKRQQENQVTVGVQVVTGRPNEIGTTDAAWILELLGKCADRLAIPVETNGVHKNGSTNGTGKGH